MLIPLGKVDSEVRRLPWVTFAIMGICFVIHLSLVSKVDKANLSTFTALKRLILYYEYHPYLEIPESVRHIFPKKRKRKTLMEALLSSTDKYRSTKKPTDPAVVAEQQEDFEALAAQALKILRSHPYYKTGLIPAQKNFFSMISHMFVHGDWWHLIFNMLFLYITAPFIEDAWGKIHFAVFYLVAGIISAMMFSIHYPNLATPLIGASGAVSGIMGAFMIRFATEKLKFFYWFYYFAGTFTAPAGFILPVFLGLELFNAKMMDSINPQGGGGVAHWVHVWGFVIGIAVALIIKYFKYEEKVISPSIREEEKFEDESYSMFEEAMDLRMKGQGHEAFPLLMQVAAAKPTDPQVIDALWETSMELGRQVEAAPFLHKLVETEIRRKQFDAARFHFAQLSQAVPQIQLSPPAAISFIEMLLKRGERQQAELIGHSLLNVLHPGTPPGILLQFAVTAMQLGPQWADPALELCFNHPEILESKKEDLTKQRQQLERIYKSPGTASSSSQQHLQPPPVPAATTPAGVAPVMPPPVPPGIKTPQPSPDTPPPDDDGPIQVKLDFSRMDNLVVEHGSSATLTQTPPGPAQAPPPGTLPVQNNTPSPPSPPDTGPLPFWKLKVSHAIPIELKDDRIILKIERVGDRSLPITRIKMIAVVKISGINRRPFLLFDLFLDDPSVPGNGGQVRSVRFRSNHFDPRHFFPNPPTLMDAYRQFAFFLLNRSQARPFPHLESIQLKKLEPFDTIEDYELILSRSFGGN